MKKTIFALAALVLGSSAASGQNLDPTVEVSREYEGKLMEVHKPVMEMAVPDSVMKFDLDFDYSVFESPYKGSYEFNPYIMSMRPAASSAVKRTFYLNAGAGYTLHPQLDVLWSPALRGKAYSLDVYAHNRSYIGEYEGLGARNDWKGHDLLSKAGVTAAYDWKKSRLEVDAGYRGIASKDWSKSRCLDALDARVSLKSKPSWPEHYLYDVSLGYRFAEDKVRGQDMVWLGEHVFDFDMRFGPVFGGEHKLIVDFGFDMASQAGAVDSNIGKIALTPHYVFDHGRLHVDAGIRVDVLMRPDGPVTMYPTREQYVYPDVSVSYAMIPDAMQLYFHGGGGTTLNTYSSLVERNHFLDTTWGFGGGPLMDADVESISLVLGMQGRVSDLLSYNLRGGYVSYRNALLDAWMNSIAYAPYQKLYLGLDWNMDLECLRFDGAVTYTHAWGQPGLENVYLPAAFSGDVAVLYNWGRRIYAGVDCEFMTRRTGNVPVPVKGYADLGAYAEYVVGSRLSFWLRGGNLLGMSVQRTPFRAEKGAYFTAGVCLTL